MTVWLTAKAGCHQVALNRTACLGKGANERNISNHRILVKRMTVEKANAGDHEILTEITKKSKSYWGYSEEQLLAWADALTISEAYMANNFVFKLRGEEGIVGYYAYYIEDEKTLKLDNLFVLPAYIGKGFGKALLEDFLRRARDTFAERIVLESDPHAERFYEKFGFVKIGAKETSIKHRFLPIMARNIST